MTDAREAALPEWWHLKAYGYAPGGYMSKCRKCGQTPIAMDKRATTCRPCAEVMYAYDLAAPAPTSEGLTKLQLIDHLAARRQALGGSVSEHNHRRILATRTRPELLAMYERIVENERRAVPPAPAPAPASEGAPPIADGFEPADMKIVVQALLHFSNNKDHESATRNRAYAMAQILRAERATPPAPAGTSRVLHSFSSIDCETGCALPGDCLADRTPFDVVDGPRTVHGQIATGFIVGVRLPDMDVMLFGATVDEVRAAAGRLGGELFGEPMIDKRAMLIREAQAS